MEPQIGRKEPHITGGEEKPWKIDRSNLGTITMTNGFPFAKFNPMDSDDSNLRSNRITIPFQIKDRIISLWVNGKLIGSSFEDELSDDDDWEYLVDYDTNRIIMGFEVKPDDVVLIIIENPELLTASDKIKEVLDNLTSHFRRNIPVGANKGTTTHEYTTHFGDRVKDVIDWETGKCDRYVSPVLPVERVEIKVAITRDGLKGDNTNEN
jgi:hypothetical protein